jgi:Rrf2 family protein
MKLSHRAIYAIRALFDLAYHGGQRPVQIREVACREEIPARFLEQILQTMRQAGLVHSTRGPRGGYSLSKSPEDISLADILVALQEEPCFQAPSAADECGPDAPNKDLSWRFPDEACAELLDALYKNCSQITLAHIIQRAQADGLPSACAERFVYVI